MQVLFKVIRQHSQRSPWVQTYALEVEPSATVLDCLNRIKWEQDGTLAFRKNCRNTICGSCSMRINGRAALACKQTVQQELAQFWAPEAGSISDSEAQLSLIPTITVAPMGNMPVIKDLVVDMGRFWQNLKAVDPYVSTAGRQVPEREFLQSPADRAKLDQTGNCILCGACYSDCNAREVDETFVGPHALAKAYRLLADTRDQATEARLSQSNQGTAGVWGCTRCFNCNAVCPMDVAPLDQISRIKTDILEHQQGEHASRPVRHRQVLLELVKAGGWIDERQFGLQVVGDRGRDWRGLLSLVPLGLNMLRRGKFPTRFEPSAGTAQVRSLIQSVKIRESRSAGAMNSQASEENLATEREEPSTESEPAFGWTSYAERINGRFAMIGLVALLLLELVTHQDFFSWLGLR